MIKLLCLTDAGLGSLFYIFFEYLLTLPLPQPWLGQRIRFLSWVGFARRLDLSAIWLFWRLISVELLTVIDKCWAEDARKVIR